MTTTELDHLSFEQQVTAPGITLVDWWAPWCGPCRRFAPIYEETATENEDIFFAKVNTEEQRELGALFQIRSIPTLMVFRDGVLLFNQAGMLPKKALTDLIAQVRALDMEEVRATIEGEREKSTTVPLS